MSASPDRRASPLPWHRLLGPLPADAVVRRQPVGTPEVLATPEGASMAGWEALTIELSAGDAGLRHVMVTLDTSGRAIAAGEVEALRALVADVLRRAPGRLTP